MTGYRTNRFLWVGVLALLLAGCGTLGIGRPPLVPDSEVFRSLDTYDSAEARDLAQLLYPGFHQIRAEIQSRFPHRHLRLQENGFEIVRLQKEANVAAGYYIHLRLDAADKIPGSPDFLGQAEQVGAQYLPGVMQALSRDWEHVFSPSVTGTVIDYFWDAGSRNRMRCVFRNGDVQEYLNRQMALQELVDKNWIEGWQGDTKLGRIELNALEPVSS